MAYEPIRLVRTLNGSQPAFLRALEAATQTFNEGVPLVLSSGYVQEAAFGGSEVVYGVSAERGHNLAAAGVAQELNEGDPPNQPSAVTTPVGAWVRDGKCGLWLADGNNVFSAKMLASETFDQSYVTSTRYTLVKDGTSLYWYVTIASPGTDDEDCINILGQDPSTPNTAGNVRVFFMFNASARHWA